MERRAEIVRARPVGRAARVPTSGCSASRPATTGVVACNGELTAGADTARGVFARIGAIPAEGGRVLARAMKTYVRSLYSRLLLEGSRRKGTFSPEFYLRFNPDVAAAGIDPYTHYIRHGRAEGRLASMPSLKVDGSLEALDRRRSTVLVVSHEGSRTGAPVLSYNIVEHLLPKHNVVALFLGPGPMLEACRAAGAVVVGPVALHGSAFLCDAVIEQIVSGVSIKFALINSIESRHVLPALVKRRIATVNLVHEFAAYTRPPGAFREAVYFAGRTVFSSDLTRDNALVNFPDLAGCEFPVLPQGRCLLPKDVGDATDDLAEEASRIRRMLRPEGFPVGGAVVLGAGFVQFRKGVDLFIACAARVRELAPDLPCRFVWVGKGYDPEKDVAYSAYLADQIRRADLEDEVLFMGEVVDLASAYAAADLLLLSSRLDPLPNVAIDALASGLPVVCFDKATGMAGVLRDHGLEHSCVAPFLDSEQMARKVAALVRSKDLRERVASKGKEVLASTFDMSRYVARLEELALREVDRALHEREDEEEIAASELPRLDFFCPPGAKHSRSEAVRGYVRSWSSGVGRRKLFPGFHPGVYLERHGVSRPRADPLADYLRAGRPRGPWSLEVIGPGEEVQPLPAGFRVALHVHAHYDELFPELLKRLEQNRVRPALLVSATSERVCRAVENHLEGYAGDTIDLRIVPNRGRDIGPFLTEFGSVLDRYDVVGHLHTKKTSDLKDAAIGRSWYEFLQENLLGGVAPMADLILGKMASSPALGMVFPDDPNVVGWGLNLRFATALVPGLLREVPREMFFPIGTMFWARPGALRRLLDLGLDWKDYPEEPLPYDGSVLHALERLFGVVTSFEGYAVAVTNVPGKTR